MFWNHLAHFHFSLPWRQKNWRRGNRETYYYHGSFFSLGIKELGLHCYCPVAIVSKESVGSLTLSREEGTEMAPRARPESHSSSKPSTLSCLHTQSISGSGYLHRTWGKSICSGLCFLGLFGNFQLCVQHKRLLTSVRRGTVLAATGQESLCRGFRLAITILESLDVSKVHGKQIQGERSLNRENVFLKWKPLTLLHVCQESHEWVASSTLSLNVYCFFRKYYEGRLNIVLHILKPQGTFRDEHRPVFTGHLSFNSLHPTPLPWFQRSLIPFAFLAPEVILPTF